MYVTVATSSWPAKKPLLSDYLGRSCEPECASALGSPRQQSASVFGKGSAINIQRTHVFNGDSRSTCMSSKVSLSGREPENQSGWAYDQVLHMYPELTPSRQAKGGQPAAPLYAAPHHAITPVALVGFRGGDGPIMQPGPQSRCRAGPCRVGERCARTGRSRGKAAACLARCRGVGAATNAAAERGAQIRRLGAVALTPFGVKQRGRTPGVPSPTCG